jgi:hypothetical protein
MDGSIVGGVPETSGFSGGLLYRLRKTADFPSELRDLVVTDPLKPFRVDGADAHSIG